MQEGDGAPPAADRRGSVGMARHVRRRGSPRRATMIDVANEARVSQTTVSLVLNHADGARLVGQRAVDDAKRDTPHHDVQAVLVACRKGIRIRPDEAACRPGPGSEIAVVPLDEPDATMPVHVVWRRGEKAPPVVAFVNTARSVLRAETRSAPPLRERAAVAN